MPNAIACASSMLPSNGRACRMVSQFAVTFNWFSHIMNLAEPTCVTKREKGTTDVSTSKAIYYIIPPSKHTRPECSITPARPQTARCAQRQVPESVTKCNEKGTTDVNTCLLQGHMLQADCMNRFYRNAHVTTQLALDRFPNAEMRVHRLILEQLA